MAKPDDPGSKGRENAREHGGNAFGPGGNPNKGEDEETPEAEGEQPEQPVEPTEGQ